MNRWTHPLSCALIVCIVAASGAEEPVPPPTRVPPPAAASTPLPHPPPPAAPGSVEQPLSKVEHLRRAAEHLEAAGAEDLAREIREEAEAMLEASVEVLYQKREQLARLQREIAALEELTGLEQQIMLRCRVVEIDLAELNELGLDWAYLVEDGAKTPGGINDSGLIATMLDALASNGTAKILAEPVIITTIGRPATLRSGGEFPILVPQGPDKATVDWRNFGITLEAVPVVLGDGRVRLDVAPELATRDFANAVTIDGFSVPGLNVRRINTQVEMEFGETVTLVMPSPGEVEHVRQTSAEEGGDEQGQTVTIFCVTPERVRPVREHPVPQPQPVPAPIQVLPTY